MADVAIAQDGALAQTQELNEEQLAAVTADNGPLLIVAGAGTGKTMTLAHRVAHLVREGADPGRVMLLTFSRRAAAEMLRRADAVLQRSMGSASGHAIGARVWGGTFHSVAARLLRAHARDIGLPADFTILDRADSEDLMHFCRTDLGLASSSKRFPQKSTCLDIYSRCVNAQMPLKDVLAATFPWCRHAEDGLAQLFGAYTDAKEAQHVLDYDDLLLFWRAMLADPVAGELVRERFDSVLVDEYQDTNAVQADIIEMLRPEGVGLTCVGDDAQAIYGFRAATVRNILDFTGRFPRAHIATLARNYRSSRPILEATNAIAEKASERHEKHLWTNRSDGERPTLVVCADEAEQTRWLVERILDHRERGCALREQAVLFRAQHHSIALEMELSRRNIPFRKYGGLRFSESAHVKDLVAFLRLAENPFDALAARRVLGLVPGIGPKTAAHLQDLISHGGGDFEPWVSAEVPEAARVIWPDLVGTLRSLGGMKSDAATQVHAARQVLSPLIERIYDNPAPRLADLEQIESLAGSSTTRTALLAELAIDPPSWTGDLAGPPHLDEDWLVLSTMHSAKGLEYDVVYVMHAADGNIPSDMATGSTEEIEEERRLFYVACTRARNHLYVTHPLRYYKAGNPMTDRHGFAQRTRFIDDEVLAHFAQESAGRLVAAEESATSSAGQVRASARDSVRQLW